MPHTGKVDSISVGVGEWGQLLFLFTPPYLPATLGDTNVFHYWYTATLLSLLETSYIKKFEASFV